MRKLEKGDRIGFGASKNVYESKTDPNLVIGEYHRALSKGQIKSAYYLSKLAHLLFPKNFPDIRAGFNQQGGPSILYIERGHRDETHEIINYARKHSGQIITNNERVQYNDKIKSDPDVIKLIKQASQKGFKLDANAQNFSRDPDGNVLYLETNPAWESDEKGHQICWVDPKKLREAILELKKSDMELAKIYYDRLIELMPK